MTEQRFWSKVNKTESCWLWTAGIFSNGYGQYKNKGKMLKAHRYSYELHKGKIAEGLLIRHTCDVRSCVNPNHLLVGTQQDNINDMIERNRHRYAKGESCHNAILTKDDVIEIRIFREFGFTQQELGKMYGVVRETIKNVLLKKTWSHI